MLCYENISKLANLVPVSKNESRSLCNNCKPISLLSNAGKIFKKLMLQRLSQFLEDNSFILCQFGYRLSLSTNNALMFVIENTQTRLDDNELASGVFINLMKAFDTVDDKILIGKLEHYGVRGIAKAWLSS